MFNERRIKTLEAKVKLLIEDTLEAHRRIAELGMEIFLLKNKPDAELAKVKVADDNIGDPEENK